MTYSKTVSGTTLCTATITRKKNRVKSYGDPASITPLKYFLKDGEEFEIELFNPFQTQVLAKIKMNGTPISSSGVVLLPGQRVFLERFLDTNEKFAFKTYDVENSKEAKNAIAKNGEVVVEFFHEKIKPLNIPSWNYNTYNYNTYVAQPGWLTTTTPYFGNTTNLSTNLGNTFSTTGVTMDSCYFSNANIGASSLNISNTLSSNINESKIETGRISGGTASSQTFETVYGDFNLYSSQTASMQILPESQKPVEVSEIRNYCPNCRTRIKKSSWKFCPSCGEKF